MCIKEDVIKWIIRNQFGRRNLPTYVRAKLSLRLEDIIKARAKENQKLAKGGDRKSNNAKKQGFLNSEKVDSYINTDKELAKIAGVSADTIWKTRVVENEGSEEVQARARKGEICISKAFNLTRKPEKMKERMSERGKIGADMTNIGGDSFGHTPIEPTSQRKELAKISGTSEDDISIFICNNKNYMYNLDKTKRWRIKHGN